MNSKIPQRKSNILMQQIGGETLLYNTEVDAIHCLNPTTKLIWDLCDGSHTIADIVHWLQYSASLTEEAELMHKVETTVAMFSKQGLLRIRN